MPAPTPNATLTCAGCGAAFVRRELERFCPPCCERELAAYLAASAPAPVAPVAPVACATCDAQRAAGPMGAAAIEAGAPHAPRTPGHRPHCSCNGCWRD